MNNYPLADYCLEFENDYRTLNVVERTSGNIACYVILTSEAVKVEVIDEKYKLTTGDCELCYTQSFEVILGQDSFQFDGAIANGVGTILIRDTMNPEPVKVRRDFTYFLDKCSVTLSHNDAGPNALKVKSPCSANCTEPQSGCRSYSDTPVN